MRTTLLGAVLCCTLAAGPALGAERPLTLADAAAGKALYLQECSGCHGERGDGAGPATDFLEPKPRDFTRRLFKFRTTPSGQPPATDDILRTIERGIPGTAMPSFAFLPEADRRKIAAHVLRLADMLEEPEPPRVPDPGNPPAATAETVAEGKQLYVDAGCVSCHGPKGTGEGAQEMKDADGRPIAPRDLTADAFRGGTERSDVYHRLATGMDGTPMPSYVDALDPPRMWALVDYVLSLRVATPPAPLPADAIAAGRAVTEKYHCRGCHVLDDGRGGDVGPDLRVSGQKLDPTWVRTFLRDPRAHGKIYPFRVARMPKLPLSEAEVDALARYLAAVGKRPDAPIEIPATASFPAAKVEAGKNFYVLRCTECHNLGKVIETPPVKQQGPDLIRVAGRIDYAWTKDWILDPKKIDPKTKMVMPGGLAPDDADAIRMFVWKAAVEAGPLSRR